MEVEECKKSISAQELDKVRLGEEREKFNMELTELERENRELSDTVEKLREMRNEARRRLNTLSNDVRKEYQIMVEMCIRGLVALPGFVEQFPGLSEEQSITTLEKDFVVNVEIKVGKKKENSQVLGFIMNVTVMPSFDTKNEVSLTDELAALGPDGMVGEPRRPKSKFWKGDRTKPQEVTLRIELPGCRIMKGKDQYTYLEFPKGNCAAPPVLVARSAGPSGFKGKEFQEELAPFTGDLSKVKME